MTENSSASRPAPMEGGGAYNRSSSVQAAGLSPAVPLFEQAAKTVPLPTDPTPIVIADYGSSEGRNSLAPMSAAIRTFRNRVDPKRAISVVHTDLAENDFSALFQTLFLHGVELGVSAESTHLGWRKITDADRPNLALAAQVFQRPRGLRNRCLEVWPMHLVKVDDIRA